MPGHSFLASIVGANGSGDAFVVIDVDDIGRVGRDGFGFNGFCSCVGSQHIVSSIQFEVFFMILAGFSHVFFNDFNIQYPGHIVGSYWPFDMLRLILVPVLLISVGIWL